jgi:hypothetical protein
MIVEVETNAKVNVRLTSNMTFLRRTLNVIGGLYDRNVQILPTQMKKIKTLIYFYIIFFFFK